MDRFLKAETLCIEERWLTVLSNMSTAYFSPKTRYNNQYLDCYLLLTWFHRILISMKIIIVRNNHLVSRFLIYDWMSI